VTGSTPAIRVHYADRREISSDTIAALVTDEDRQRLVPAMHARRRSEYLATRALLRSALADYTGCDGASFQIEVTADGKPECVGGPAVSVSHSRDFLVCALAPSGAVGIDVEVGVPRQALGTLAERFFTPAEARWLAADPAPRFRMLWVLKEAYLKALGVGLAGGLASLECLIAPPRIVARTADGAPAPHLVLLEGQGCFVGVAAVHGAAAPAVDVRRFAGATGADGFGPLELVATGG
jgi:phosphopantetheinyl transferase